MLLRESREGVCATPERVADRGEAVEGEGVTAGSSSLSRLSDEVARVRRDSNEARGGTLMGLY